MGDARKDQATMTMVERIKLPQMMLESHGPCGKGSSYHERRRKTLDDAGKDQATIDDAR